MAGVNGFDVEFYPGDAVFDWLRQFDFRVVCFYLTHQPGRPDRTWSKARRNLLASKGWGFFPTYVGLQKGSSKLSSQAGTKHAGEAIVLMLAAGFAVGSVVYLDLESGDSPDGSYADYIAAWIAEISGNQFVPALYCSHRLIKWAVDKVDVIWSFNVPKNTNGKTYNPNALPNAAIDAKCIATQYRQEIKLKGLTIPPSVDKGIDLDLCSVPDPSHFASVAHRLRLS